MMRWSFAISWIVGLAGTLLLAGSVWLSYLNWRRSGRRKPVARLEGFRLAIIALLVFTLTRPELVWQVKRTDVPVVAVLCDGSGSMTTRDVIVSNAPIARAKWIARQRQAAPWRPLERSARVAVEEFSTAPVSGTNAAASSSAPGSAPAVEPGRDVPAAERPPVDPGTDLDGALADALHRHLNLKAVLLLSDGDWNVGRSPVGIATRYRDQEIPVFAVGVGSDQPMPDLVLEPVAAPAYGLFGEQISIPFRLASHLAREVKTEIVLRDGDREETRRAIVVPANGELQDAVIWAPRAVGERKLSLEVPVQPEESIVENNRQTFRIEVRVETLRVLVVDSLPRWEYRYLRNALARDPGVEVRCVLFHPGMEPGGGNQYLPAFPNTKELLGRYDVVFLGDVGIGGNELQGADAELLKGLVEQQASGLVFMPGRRGRHLTWLESPLKDLLPVVLDRTKPEGIHVQSESTLALTSPGKRHWLTRFDASESRNDEIWRQLPGFFWSAAVEKNRPGSEVLAVHSAHRNQFGRLPLLVTRSAGAGKVLFMGTDSAWRWRRGVEDKYHYRFWSQVVRWMAHQRHLSGQQGIRLAFSPEAPNAGDTVYLQATVLDAAGSPLEKGTVSGRVTLPSRRAERLELTPQEGGWGVFTASFLATEAGAYTLRVGTDDQTRALQTTLQVHQPKREKTGLPVNWEVLRELARITGGVAGPTADLERILAQISVLPEPRPVEQRLRLWCNPWWGGALLMLWTIYWTARKLMGLL